MSHFADHRLGKGVVVAKDTPNFIGNHLALYGVMLTLKALESGRYTIEEIDAITGPALGRPKSATFRTMDIAGIDILAHVAKNLGFELPAFVNAMIEKGWVGEKAGQGFYKRIKTASGSEIQTLDPATLTYRPKQSARLASLEAARSIEDTGARIKTLFLGKDKVGDFLRETLGKTLLYTAKVTPDIAYSIDDVDRVMQWGFGWELGPFEIMDAIGIASLIGVGRSGDRRSRSAFPAMAEVLAAGRNRFRDGAVPPAAPDLQILKSAKDRQKVVRKNAGASLVDLGDGVLALEFHAKMNAIGGDQVQMMHAGVKEAAANFAALVVGNDAPNFSAGANLMLLLLEAQEGNWDEIDLMIRAFQGSTQALRYADVPVIVAPAGPDARRRLRDRAARRPRAGGRGELHRPRRGRRRPDSPAAAARRRCWRAPSTACRRTTRICCRSCSACSRRSASPRSRPAPRTPGASASSATRIASR